MTKPQKTDHFCQWIITQSEDPEMIGHVCQGIMDQKRYEQLLAAEAEDLIQIRIHRYEDLMEGWIEDLNLNETDTYLREE